MASVRKSFIETRNIVKILDSTLSPIILMNILFEIFSVMTQIYILITSGKYEIIQKISATFVFSIIINSIKLICDCVINGLVYEEAEKLFSCLDHISISKSPKEELTFKEVIFFKSISRDLKFGFTIAGFMPLRKTTLTSVRNLFLIL